MKIILLGKSNQLGSTPSIRVKGLSQVRYNFIWDAKIRHFAYEPKNQKEVDDIFRTMGKIYNNMYFSVYLDAEPDHHFVKESSTIEGAIRQSTDNPIKKKKTSKKKESTPDLQGVDELVTA